MTSLDQISFPIGILILLAAYITRSKLTDHKDTLKQLPWVGRRVGFLSGLRARVDSLRSTALETSDNGYKKFSASGRAFVLPGFDQHSVIVPGSQIKWLTDQPDDVLSAAAMQRDSIQTDYSLLDPAIARHNFQEVCIRRDLTRSLGGLIPEIEEELNVSADKYWGTDGNGWNDVCVYDTMMRIVTRTSNRVFVGLPLCRNDDYLDNSCKYVQDIALSGAIIKLIPDFMKPLTAWIFQLPTRWHLHRALKHLLPVLKSRMSSIEEAYKSGKEAHHWNDFAGWYMDVSRDNPNPRERTPEMIAKRVMATNFAAIHTSTFTATNIFLDLYSSPQAGEFVAALREEITEVLAANGGQWNKAAVSKLVRVDSAVRESMRISIFQSHGLYRLVVDPNGVTMHDGLHLPQGTKVGTSTYSIHHDDHIYENAHVYDALRFSRAREESADMLKAKNLSTVTTSDIFLSFGHGKHACPGRFFAITEMKLLLAYIVMNYDVKPLATRPQNHFTAGFRLPPRKATLSVKRRFV